MSTGTVDLASESTSDRVEHVDVLVVGAGISGIGAGYHLQHECPGKSYAILEAREAIGGTWDLFRYPGIRSDSDMYTLGFPFRPWDSDTSIADGQSILTYLRETASAYGIDQKIRFGHRVARATWSSEEDRWTVEATRTDTGQSVVLTCSFLFMCTGYYRYDQGFTPNFPGTERFQGRIIHPQFWPEDLDYAGQRVVVIGSGATAATLVPSMAEKAGHVTMLQRSPSYMLSIPGQDPLAGIVRRLLPIRRAYSVVRWKNVLIQLGLFKLSRRRPKLVKGLIRKDLERRLPAGFDIDTHFKPRYNPWDQRFCFIPDGDLFDAIRGDSVSVVTDEIETFTEKGIRLRSGRELEADLIVTATGLILQPIGGAELVVDGQPVELPTSMVYKGCMLSGVPNFALSFGYTNASWTLKADLICQYVCRLVNHMESHGYTSCRPVNRDPTVTETPFVDFTPGYFLRAMNQ
ncbi:MAG TPA: NAD(P)/FAD-dependent oxidoreductase, partial [Solirubrobacteraceae bacterium]|nr:NAD(P)/FAD-dependent oxidoreductase [Solirubrobacteraceae bacterium]